MYAPCCCCCGGQGTAAGTALVKKDVLEAIDEEASVQVACFDCRVLGLVGSGLLTYGGATWRGVIYGAGCSVNNLFKDGLALPLINKGLNFGGVMVENFGPLGGVRTLTVESASSFHLRLTEGPLVVLADPAT